jgi:hypothetical protein
LIYICIPTHDEQQTVGVVLWKLRQVLTEFPRDYQLLVADDASRDKTPEVLEPYTRVLPLTVIRSERRIGQAASLEMLLREAVRRSEYPKRDIIITLQADFSEEPDDVVPMIKRIEAGADIAVGNKVSVAKMHWTRRLARRLGGMFTAGQAWPEGVASPFDGYRAYRLYGVKRAMEDRPDRRLLRYGGWAGAAELLRAVLPHVRRVDVIDVEDRSDRLQRPRRERAFAAAMQVRPMMRDVDPPDLLPLEALDAMAATASRSRGEALEAAREKQRAGGNGRAASTRRQAAAPSEQRRGRGGRERGAERAAGETRPRAEAGERRPRNGADAPGKSQGERSARGGSRAGSGPGRGRERRKDEQAAPAAPAAAPLAADPGEVAPPHGDPLTGTVPPLDGEAAGSAEAKPKKRRRRGRRGGSGRAAAAGTATESDAGDAELAADVADAGEPTAEQPDGEAGTSTPDRPKRRRRGGRRGGRNRRRGSAGGAVEGEGADEGADEGGADDEAPAAVSEARAPEAGGADRSGNGESA